MSVAIMLENGVVPIVPTMAFAEHLTSWADVGPIQEDDGVEPCDGGVHGGDASIGNEKLPRARKSSTCGDDGESKGKKKKEAETEREIHWAE